MGRRSWRVIAVIVIVLGVGLSVTGRYPFTIDYASLSMWLILLGAATLLATWGGTSWILLLVAGGCLVAVPFNLSRGSWGTWLLLAVSFALISIIGIGVWMAGLSTKDESTKQQEMDAARAEAREAGAAARATRARELARKRLSTQSVGNPAPIAPSVSLSKPSTVKAPAPATGAKFCTGCGAARLPEAKFCVECGAPIS